MITEMLERAEILKKRNRNICSVLTSIRNKKEVNEQKLEELKVKHELMEEDIQVQEDSISAYSSFLAALSNEKLERLKVILNKAITTVFYDRNYSVEFEIGDRSVKKTLTLYLVEELANGNILRVNIKDSVGGGIMSIVSFVLRVYYILYFNLERVMFLDEAFSMLSDEYINPVIQFMKSLSDMQGFRFVFISHDSRVLQYSSEDFIQVYEVSKGQVEKK